MKLPLLLLFVGEGKGEPPRLSDCVGVSIIIIAPLPLLVSTGDVRCIGDGDAEDAVRLCVW